MNFILECIAIENIPPIVFSFRGPDAVFVFPSKAEMFRFADTIKIEIVPGKKYVCECIEKINQRYAHRFVTRDEQAVLTLMADTQRHKLDDSLDIAVSLV